MARPESSPGDLLLGGHNRLAGEVLTPRTVYESYGHMTQASDLDLLLDRLEFENFEQHPSNWQLSNENMIVWSGASTPFLDPIALAQRASEIREKLKYAAAIQNPPYLPPKEVVEAIELVTPERIATYSFLYFANWHLHAPMVHEATFNPCTAALPLALSVMSLGAMYSKEVEDVAKVKVLLDTIECCIYSIPGLSDEYDLPGRQYIKQGANASSAWQQYQLEELQGAYLIIVLQYWTGNTAARARVRQQRFPRVVQARVNQQD